ncbi:hypothetical protein OG792_16365 [Micromonospora sp. NBC_01699]|uniref:Rv0361 family membrane protein n=1 Tax=Micromonospora sp. NBC_01699 TaxID=2975984 RepID=UPI002E30D151|nr:hypothetical protein [Micromonospora sp. NBC_01699]
MAYEMPRSRTRPRRALRRALVVVGLTLFVCCVGAAGLAAWNFQSVRQATGPAKRAAGAFLDRVAAGDHAGAYDRLCAATRGRWSLPRFTSRVDTPPTISRYTVEDVTIASRDGRRSATVTVALTRVNGAVDDHDLPVVDGDDGWQVCGDPF